MPIGDDREANSLPSVFIRGLYTSGARGDAGVKGFRVWLTVNTCWFPLCYANLSSQFLILQYWWWQPTLNPLQGFPFYFIVKTWSFGFLSCMIATQKISLRYSFIDGARDASTCTADGLEIFFLSWFAAWLIDLYPSDKQICNVRQMLYPVFC